MKKNLFVISLITAAATATATAQSTDSLFPADLPLAPVADDPFAALNDPSQQPPSGALLPDEIVMQAPLLQPQRPQSSQVTASIPAGQQATTSAPGNGAQSGVPPVQAPSPESQPAEGVSARVAAIENEIPRITNDDLAALNPVIPEAPSWLSTQQRLDVQFYVHKRALERESELASIRADIAENEKRTRVALTEEDESAGNGRRPPFFNGVPTANIDPNNFDQLAALAALQGTQPPRVEPTPPPPPPPTLVLVSADTAVLEYGGVRQTVSAGDTVGGKYRVENIDYNAVTIRDGAVRTKLTVSW